MVIVEYKDGYLGISACSDGSVNVQVIMEELGGGHQTVAGVKIANKRAKDEAVVLGAQIEKITVNMKVGVGENGKW